MLEPPGMCCHAAVCVENHIIVLGGNDENYVSLPCHNIWMYNVYTEQWGKHVIRNGKDAPPGTDNPCAVVIKGDIYMFGGWLPADTIHTNALWRLSRTPERCFEWSKGIARTEKKTPSPRECHSGWEYKGQLWTFGGLGIPLVDYLNDHGNFIGNDIGENNQLLCYDPLSEHWRSLNPSGTIPEPRSEHASTIIGDKVWIYGGLCTNPYWLCDEFYQLNMVSLTWTEIQFNSGQLKPPCRGMCSLTAVTENQIVLQGGRSASNPRESLNGTWILDVSSLSWKTYKLSKGDTPCIGQTGNACINSSIISIGGEMKHWDGDGPFSTWVYSGAYYLRLEPKTLQ